MAVLGRLLLSSAERLDLPDLLSIDSFTAGDFKFFTKALFNDTRPYILRGFDVATPAQAIGSQGISINVADSVVFYPGSLAGPFFYGLPQGNPMSEALVPELKKNATNYVYLTFDTTDTATDTRAFWDPDANGGTGGEFTQDVNTESVLQVNVNVSVASFPDNVIPICKVVVGPSVIVSIEDARDLMFRLGTGGISPDPFNKYNFRPLPSISYTREEPPGIISSALQPNPFQGADKNILSLKEWMDAVMTKLAELGGTNYWYEEANESSLISLFADALASTLKSKGQWLSDSNTEGLLSWTEDLTLQTVIDLRDYIIRAGNKTLTNEQVMFLSLVRNQSINAVDQAVDWTNGSLYVNGIVGAFEFLNKGDWIKKRVDGDLQHLRVEQFYANTNGGGGITTPSLARSIKLSDTYGGTTATATARYSQGVYLPADVQVADRADPAITNAGGNLHWLALRSDTIMAVSSIVTSTISGDIVSADGEKAKFNSVAHGLFDGDRITIAGSANYDGTYEIEVADADNFFIETAQTTLESGLDAYIALVTTTTRSTSDGLQLESANHNFKSGERIRISATGTYDGAYLINVRGLTTFTIPVPSALISVGTGLATLVKINVRSQSGVEQIIMGGSSDIGPIETASLRKFVGQENAVQDTPNYHLPPSSNTLFAQENFNSSSTDSLTARTSRLTGMMADKAQDKTLKYLTDAITAVNNQNGAAQELTFTPSGSILTILQPGSPGNAVFTLPDVTPISLLVNQSAYIEIDRNAASAPTATIANNEDVPVGENILVLASRLSDQTIYLWNGLAVVGSAYLSSASTSLIKVRLHDPVNTSLPTGNPVIIDGITVNAGDLVLFSALSVNPNRIYKAVGTGTNITSWVAQPLFSGIVTPTDGDTVIVQEGTGFADQIGKFTGTAFVFNDKVRYFNGTDYWEQSNIVTSTLADNTTGNVFTVNFSGSEYMVIDYSINRGLTRESGTLHVVTDGTNVSVTTSGAYIGSSGVSFSGDISGLLIRLRFTTTSTGTAATMKYMIRRWSNGAGGPGGVPSYTSSTPSSPAFGPSGAIQYNDGGLLNGSANFKIDTVDGSFDLNGLKQTALSSGITLLDNTAVAAPVFTYSAASYPFAVIEYSISRNGNFRVGRLLVTNDTSAASSSDDFVDTASTGITLTTDVSAGNVRVLYTSTNTGFNGTFKYSMRKWS